MKHYLVCDNYNSQGKKETITKKYIISKANTSNKK